MTAIIETKKLSNGGVVRLQKRGDKFDVISNCHSVVFRYVQKAVTEQKARDAFFLATLEA
jgi:hypothetical protein